MLWVSGRICERFALAKKSTIAGVVFALFRDACRSCTFGNNSEMTNITGSSGSLNCHLSGKWRGGARTQRTHPCCQDVTHSCVGTNLFLPTPARAIRSKLRVISIDIDALSLIFPLTFSESVSSGIDPVVGETNSLGASSSRLSPRCGESLGCGGGPGLSSDDSRLELASLSNNRAFSMEGSSPDSRSPKARPLPLVSPFRACSSLANWTRRISRRPRARVKVPRSSNVLWARSIP